MSVPGAGSRQDLLPQQRYRVRTTDGEGTVIAHTYWGGGRIRWYRVLLDNGSEKSYSLHAFRRLAA